MNVRRPRHWWCAALPLVLVCVLAATTDAQEVQRTEHAYVGVHLNAVRGLDVSAGTFRAELLLWVRWRAANRIDPDAVTIENALELTREEIGREEHDGWSLRRWRVTGTFYGRFEVADFPYDDQQLTLTIAHPALASERLRLAGDVRGSGVSPELQIPGWRFKRKFAIFETETELRPPGLNGADQARSQIHFRIFLGRPLGSLLVQILVPLLVVLSMAHVSFWIDPDDASTRLMLISMAVFAAICVHFVLDEILPTGTELVIADHYVLQVYALLAAYLITATISHRFMLKERHRAAARLDWVVRWCFPVAIAIGVVAVSIPSQPTASPPPKHPASTRPELVMGSLPKPMRLGMHASSAIESFVNGLIMRPLALVDARWGLTAGLADTVPSFANGLWELHTDNTSSVRWHIRKGARWGDGEPVVSADFLATHQLIPYLGAIGVRVADDGALIDYGGPRPDAVYNVNLFPAHRLAGLNEADRQRITERDLPPLSGPFNLESWTDAELLCRRNPYFVRGTASLERIRLRFFDDKVSLVEALRKGELHLVSRDLKPAEAVALAEEVEELEVIVVDSTVVWHLEMNLDDPVLKDDRVRRALLHATDRQGMIDAVEGGLGEIAHSWLPLQHEGYDPRIPKYAYDVEKAAALLDAAGYRAGAGGPRRGPNETPLKIVIAGYQFRKPEVEFLKRSWQKVGVEVQFEPLTNDQFRDQEQHRRFKQMLFYGFVARPYCTGRKRWDTERIPTAENAWSGENLTGWRNEEVSAIHKKLEVTFNPDERVELLARQQRIWAEALPILPLYTTKAALVVNRALRNIKPHLSDRAYLSWNAESWYFEY
ncbi:ABC transporter substrate-binding protein [Planctomycetota bacterium]